jgi:long-chain fatty acid transport protein
MQIADLKPLLASYSMPTSQYAADIFFEGSSAYFGYQANVSYEINDMISAAIGVRMVSANNTYTGSIKNIMINPVSPANPGSGLTSATTFFTNIGSTANAAKTANREADAVMKGTGFTPILSVNLTPSEKLNIALRYEFKTKLELTTTVNDGKGAGLFIQDSVAIADMPAAISVGVNFKPIEKLMLSGSLNYYFDKAVDYDGQPDVVQNQIDKNFIEFGLGAEYGISEKLRVSAGWLHTITGVNSNYQSDMGYSTNTNSFGGGFGFRISPLIDLNLGGQYTIYEEGSKSFARIGPALVKETYNKKTWLIGVGLDFAF